jgi:hypothetical protein
MMQIEGFDSRSWHRLITLFAPGLASRGPFEFELRARQPGGLLLLVWEGDRVVRALHTHRGPCAIDRWDGRDAMASLAEAHDARFVLAVEQGAVAVLLDRWGARVDPDEPARDAWLLGLDALRELMDEGRLSFWPRLIPGGFPRPTAAVLDRVSELVLPAGRCGYVLLFSPERTLDTGFIVARDAAGGVSLLGPERILRTAGPLSGDAVRDGAALRSSIERTFGPAHFGLHAPTRTLEELLRSEQPGAWSRALNDGALRFDPAPPWVVAALGADVARSALSSARVALGALFERVAPALEAAARRTAGRTTVSGLLGFDLGAALGSILRRSSPSTPSDRQDEPD